MNILKRNDKPTIQGQIDDVVLAMGAHEPHTEEWELLLTRLERLKKLQSQPRPKLDPNQILAVGASVLSVAAMLRHEEFNVIASKAIGFIVKPKM